jgi:hypothetical protein
MNIYTQFILLILLLIILLNYTKIYNKIKLYKYEYIYKYIWDNNEKIKKIKLKFKNYNDIIINKDSKDIHIIKIINNISIEKFHDKLKNFELTYSSNGVSAKPFGKINYLKYISKMNKYYPNYIFHNLSQDIRTDIKKIPLLIKKLIPYPKNFFMDDIYTSYIYAVPKYSGSHFHNHILALNYLIKGKKLWIMCKNTYNNYITMKNNKWDWETVSVANNYLDPYNWFIKNFNKLIRELENISIIIQNSNEIITVPNYYYHFVLNLEPSFGITYGW